MVGGGVGVEFFVMAAGLFFFKKLERETAAPEGMDSIAYIKKRFVRFFPYTTAGLLLAFLVKRVWLYTLEGGTLTGVQLYKWFSRDIWDYLLVSMNGLNAGKSMLYCPDLDKYTDSRNFYLPIENWHFVLTRNQEELENCIRGFDEATYRAGIEAHHRELGSCETGHATELVCERIYAACYGEREE